MSDPTAGQPESETVLLHYAPRTRATTAAILLEELGAPYALKVWDIRAGAHLGPAFRAVNPMAKVPTVVHRGQVVTEMAACFLYLADAFPQAGLAPAIGDPLRGPYLRWMVFYNACFEPALIDKVAGHDPGPRMRSPYGSYEEVMNALRQQLAQGPYMLGERRLALDTLWGVALDWMLRFGAIQNEPVLAAYAARQSERDAVRKITAMDEALAPPSENGGS